MTEQEMVSWIFHMFILCVTCLKREGFQEEKEWRLVYCPYFNPSAKLITQSTQIIGGVPQLIYSLPLDESSDPNLADIDLSQIFDRLIIGPSPYPKVMSDAFVSALSKIGVHNAKDKVVVSEIPIRS